MNKYLMTVILVLMTAVGYNAYAALSATISASPSPTTINHPLNVSVAINNTGGSQLTVSNIKLTATSTQAPSSSRLPVAFSVFNQGPNSSVTIGPNATTTVSAGQAIFFSPSTGITGSGSGTFSIGATIFTSDGSVTAPNAAAVVTINPIPLPASERQ